MRYSDLIGTQMTYFSGGKITYSPYPSQELDWKSKKKLSTGRGGSGFYIAICRTEKGIYKL